MYMTCSKFIVAATQEQGKISRRTKQQPLLPCPSGSYLRILVHTFCSTTAHQNPRRVRAPWYCTWAPTQKSQHDRHDKRKGIAPSMHAPAAAELGAVFRTILAPPSACSASETFSTLESM